MSTRWSRWTVVGWGCIWPFKSGWTLRSVHSSVLSSIDHDLLIIYNSCKNHWDNATQPSATEGLTKRLARLLTAVNQHLPKGDFPIAVLKPGTASVPLGYSDIGSLLNSAIVTDEQLMLIFRICLFLPHVWSFLGSSTDHINIFILGQRWPFLSHCDANCCIAATLRCSNRSRSARHTQGSAIVVDNAFVRPFDSISLQWSVVCSLVVGYANLVRGLTVDGLMSFCQLD